MEYKYVVSDASLITPTTFLVTAYAQNPRRIMPYKPGQYATISFLSHKRPTPARCFSIVSSPDKLGWLQFAMRVKGDYTKSAARKIKKGAVLTIEGPFGGFVANPYRDRSLVMLAGGIGITPFMSMIRSNVYNKPFSDMTLIYSCHSQEEVAFADELIAASHASAYFRVIFVIGDGPANQLTEAGMPVTYGRVNADLLDGLMGNVYNGRSFFLCGPEGFMDSLEGILQRRGVSRRRILTEVFSREVPQQTVPIGRPVQIYALTALSLVGVTGLVFSQDTHAIEAKAKQAEQAAKQEAAQQAAANKRQQDLDRAIADLKQVLDQEERDRQIAEEEAEARAIAEAEAAARIEAKAAATEARAAKPVPVPPKLSLTASDKTIEAGSSTKLTWKITNEATTPLTCKASGGWSGTKKASGSLTVRPSETTTYRLTCTNKGGSTSKSVTIRVEQPEPEPEPKPEAKPKSKSKPSSKGS